MKLKTRVIVTLLILLFIAVAAYAFFKEGTLPVDKNDKSTQIFVITPGQDLTDIANKLEKEELIRNRMVFYMVVKQLDIDKKIQAGDFRLSPSQNIYQIAQSLTRGSLDTWVTIIEGLRKEEVAQVVSESIDLPESEFIKAADEGYLFPDTYLIPKNATVDEVINILTSTFNARYRQAKSEVGHKNDLTDEQVVTLASLIEKEARFDEDRLKIANILVRRLNEDMPLQVDATLQYIHGYESREKRWWRNTITNADKEVDSPYNTYKFTGLPFGPICNPGTASIKAALAADGKTPYLFYINDTSGKLYQGRDLEEHQKNIDRYLK